MDSYPSIFNDVIGPVMRGPSSSHCAAAVRIGRLARDLMGGRIERVLMEFDAKGSLAFTHASQGSDMGLFGGLLGWDAQDGRLLDSAAALERAGILIELRIGEYHDTHPNTYRLTLSNSSETHQMIALSTGGGMIEVVEIDGIPLSIKGDYVETLLAVDAVDMAMHETLKHAMSQRKTSCCTPAKTRPWSRSEAGKRCRSPSARCSPPATAWRGCERWRRCFPFSPAGTCRSLSSPARRCWTGTGTAISTWPGSPLPMKAPAAEFPKAR